MKNSILTQDYFRHCDKGLDDGGLTKEFQRKNPLCKIENIKILRWQKYYLVCEDRDSKNIKIDRKRVNCSKIDESLEIFFPIKGKDGREWGYCKFRIEPYSNINSIRINNRIGEGEKFNNSISKLQRNGITKNEIEWIKSSYFQYMAEEIVDFCDRRNIIETEFTIKDLKYHVIDTNPNSYGYYMRKQLDKIFEDEKFIKI